MKIVANFNLKLIPYKIGRFIKLIILQILYIPNKAIVTIKKYGFKIFFNEVIKRLMPPHLLQKNKKMVLSTQLINIDPEKIYDNSTVSVIIPAKNAGKEFKKLLMKLRRQAGLKELEIIIVDSGSTDNTLQIAHEFGSKVIEIPSKDFSHSYARNLGAENAGCNYLLFLTQDALPSSSFWVYQLLEVIKKHKVAAVSCIEQMREDADLFYRINNRNHMHFLKLDYGDRILSKPSIINHISLRKNGQLSDIACLIEKNIFLAYKFRYNYGEDLDLGIRLISDGYKLALLSSVAVIHSHNRPAYYYLKRGYVETLALNKILRGFPIMNINYENLVNQICATFYTINMIFKYEFTRITLPCKIPYFSEFMKEQFTKKYDNLNIDKPGFKNKCCDKQLTVFLQKYFSDRQIQKPDREILINSILPITNSILNYLTIYYKEMDTNLLEEFESAVFKYFALICGNYLAHCYLKKQAIKYENFMNIHNELNYGI